MMESNEIVETLTAIDPLLGVIGAMVVVTTAWLLNELRNTQKECKGLHEHRAEYEQANLKVIGGLINHLEAIQHEIEGFRKCSDDLIKRSHELEGHFSRTEQGLQRELSALRVEVIQLILGKNK